MNTRLRTRTAVSIAATLVVAGVMIGCGGSPASPTPPTTPPVVVAPPPSVPAGAVLSSISLSAASVVGGNFVTGTANLTTTAPAGGAEVALSGRDPVTLPSSVTVPAGATSATFAISTRTVGGTVASTIGGSYGGTSASVELSVTQPTVATAIFGVAGPTESETCVMADAGATLNCTFNGSTSTAPSPIVAWDWSYTAATTLTQTTLGPILTMPSVSCAWLPPAPFQPGVSWLTMRVTLRVHDSLGLTADAVENNIRLFPHGVCGY